MRVGMHVEIEALAGAALVLDAKGNGGKKSALRSCASAKQNSAVHLR
jgi:hypothetical protein